MRFSLKQAQLCLDDNVDKKKNWFSNRKNISLRVMLNFYLIFCRCQLGVAYKSFAYKINVYRKTGTKHITKFKMFQLSVEISGCLVWSGHTQGVYMMHYPLRLSFESLMYNQFTSRIHGVSIFIYLFVFCCRFFETLEEEILKMNNISKNN